MQFTQIPQQYAPLGGELRYAVSREEAGNIDIRIAGAADAALLGAKRFAAVTEAAFDAAPYLRRQLRFVPATGKTGFYSAGGRTVSVVVEASETDGGTIAATSPARTFLPGVEAPAGPCLRTSMPLNRLIPEGACDELTLLTSGACAVTVTAEAGDSTTAESYRTAESGLHLFRLDTRDFQGAECITVDAGACRAACALAGAEYCPGMGLPAGQHRPAARSRVARRPQRPPFRRGGPGPAAPFGHRRRRSPPPGRADAYTVPGGSLLRRYGPVGERTRLCRRRKTLPLSTAEAQLKIKNEELRI